MRVDDLNVGIPVQQIRHVPLVSGKMQRVKARADENPPAHAAYLLVIFSGCRFISQEVKLDLIPVDLPVIIHQHGLDSRARHIADGMQHTKHPCQYLLSLF